MAVIQITISDHAKGGCDIKITPNFRSIHDKANAKGLNSLSSAELYCLEAVQAISKRSEKLKATATKKPGIIQSLKFWK